MLNRQRYASVTDALEIFGDDPLLYEPGTGFQYSTHGYTLLSAVLEGAAGQPYLAFMDRAVFTPLGMEHTGPDDGTASDPQPAVPYHRDRLIDRLLGGWLEPRYARPPLADPSYKWAGGGLLSTATDLVRMANALMSYEFLDSAAVERLWTPQRLADGSMNPQRYGIGWRIVVRRFLIPSACTGNPCGGGRAHQRDGLAAPAAASRGLPNRGGVRTRAGSRLRPPGCTGGSARRASTVSTDERSSTDRATGAVTNRLAVASKLARSSRRSVA
jgi:CubicO group peptidase (beta-lactamase class C family)